MNLVVTFGLKLKFKNLKNINIKINQIKVNSLNPKYLQNTKINSKFLSNF